MLLLRRTCLEGAGGGGEEFRWERKLYGGGGWGGGRGAGRPLGERRLFAPGDFSFSILHLVFAQLHADKNSVSGNSSYL